MNKKLVLALLLAPLFANAALISRSYTYTTGQSLDANQNNTNENTLYNEINGNLSTANILDGTILNGDVADTQFAVTKFATIVQSTFTLVNAMEVYRRPNLVYVSATAVEVDTNTITVNRTCVAFPDEIRCVTENTASTSVNRRFIITENASLSGTKNSGLKSGYTATGNQWYMLYAVKTTDVSTDFVIVGDTITPTSGNYAALNTAYGLNGWVYLGTIPYGDGGAASTSIPKFSMAGNKVSLYNSMSGSSANPLRGIRMANTAGATSLTWTYTIGTNIGQGTVPNTLTQGTLCAGATATTTHNILDSGSTVSYIFIGGLSSNNAVNCVPDAALAGGLKIIPSGSTAQDISLATYTDNVLGLGYNPQM